MQNQHHFAPNPYRLGGILAAITILIGILLPEAVTLNLLALLLFGIASIYFGFAVADGRTKALLIEASIVLLYLGLAILGIQLSAWILVIGYVLHGFWDWGHHNRDFGAQVVSWYIPFCVLYDWIIAVFIAVLLIT